MKSWLSMKYIKSHHDGEPATKRHSGFPSLINVMGLPSRLSKAPSLLHDLYSSCYYCLSMLSLAGLLLVLQRSPSAIAIRL